MNGILQPAVQETASEDREKLLAELQGLIRGYQRDIDRVDQALAQRLEVNRTDLRCLDILFDGPLPAGQLAAGAGVTRAAATSIIDRLSDAGYVERVPDPADRRVVQARVTTALQKRVAKLLLPYIQDAAADLAAYTDHELQVLRRFFAEGRERRVAHVAHLREES